MIESDGRLYVYSTGGGSKSSADGLVWSSGPDIFAGGAIPSTTTSVVPNNKGVWAPDVIYLNGKYYLYYSIANGACAVGLVTSPTLNPNSPNYKWTDRGLVVSNNNSTTYCTIDPAPTLDADGNLWLSWGSGYSHPSSSDTIFVTRLDNATGLASSADTTKPGHPLEKGHIEASYIYYHAGYYYLFWNSGGCCDGAASSYLIHVARSQTITGAYSGTKNFYGTTGSIHGPGQIGIYDKCGASRFTYHFYPDAGGSILGENELSWGGDGWPVLGAVSTKPLTPCGPSGAGGASAVGGTAGGQSREMTGGGGGRGGMAAGGGGAPGATGGVASSGGVFVSRGGLAGGGGSGGPDGIATTGGTSGTGGASVGGVGSGGQGTAGMGAAAGGRTGVPNNVPDSGCTCEFQAGSDINDAGIALFLAIVLESTRPPRRRLRRHQPKPKNVRS